MSLSLCPYKAMGLAKMLASLTSASRHDDNTNTHKAMRQFHQIYIDEKFRSAAEIGKAGLSTAEAVYTGLRPI